MIFSLRMTVALLFFLVSAPELIQAFSEHQCAPLLHGGIQEDGQEVLTLAPTETAVPASITPAPATPVWRPLAKRAYSGGDASLWINDNPDNSTSKASVIYCHIRCSYIKRYVTRDKLRRRLALLHSKQLRILLSKRANLRHSHAL
jgi:hypothetical protein